MADLQPLGEFPDGDPRGIALGETLDGEQGLVLLRRDARRPCHLIAEPQELAQ